MLCFLRLLKRHFLSIVPPFGAVEALYVAVVPLYVAVVPLYRAAEALYSAKF